MRLLSWGVTFLVALFIAIVLVLTFTQPEFKTTVGAQILAYKTRQLPVFMYVAGAFGAGLLIGVLQALYTFFSSRAKIFQKNGRIKDLERKLAETEQRADVNLAEANRRENSQQPPAAADAGRSQPPDVKQ